MGRGGAKDCTVMFVVMTIVAVIVSCILLGVSFSILPVNNVGLLFNGNNRLLNCNQIYGLGLSGSRRVFTGLGQGFSGYTYPSTAYNTVFGTSGGQSDFSTISAKTNEGASISVDVAVQWRLPTGSGQQLCYTVYRYGGNFLPFVNNFVGGAVRDAVSGFFVQDLWLKRAVVGAAVKNSIQNVLNSNGFVFVGAQLLSLDIPTALQNAVEDTTVQSVKIATASNNQMRANVSAITRQLQAQVGAQVTVINANAQAIATNCEWIGRSICSKACCCSFNPRLFIFPSFLSSFLVFAATASAAAMGLRSTTGGEAQGYYLFKQALAANSSIPLSYLNSTALLGFAWLDTLLTVNAKKLVISVAPPYQSV
jgi:regulator of protease activity HflC (stomatin/prohibitin superfamily)